MTTLLTGANGYIGKHILRRWWRANQPVTPLYHGDRVNLERHRIECDLTRARHLRVLSETPRRFDTVVHLAGMVSVALLANPEGEDQPPLPAPTRLGLLYEANVMATANLADYCLATGVKHLIFASTQAVYGLPGTEAVYEEWPLNPLEHYAASKVACEHMLRVASRQGLNVTVLRFPGVYGGDRLTGLVHRFCDDALSKGKIDVGGRYPLPFDVLHVDDLLDAVDAVLASGGDGWRVLNIATGEPCSMDLLADDVAALVGGCIAVHSPVPQPTIRMDASLAQSVLEWKAKPRKERLAQVLGEMNGHGP